MAWESVDPNECGFFAHVLEATDIIVYIGDFDYTVCDGSVLLGSFTTLQDAMAFAEDYDSRWCADNIPTDWVNPNTGRKRGPYGPRSAS